MSTKVKKQRSPINPDQPIQFKDIQLLKKFITEHGKILPQHRTKLTKKQQRELKKAVKKARILSLLPFTIND